MQLFTVVYSYSICKEGFRNTGIPPLICALGGGVGGSAEPEGCRGLGPVQMGHTAPSRRIQL